MVTQNIIKKNLQVYVHDDIVFITDLISISRSQPLSFTSNILLRLIGHSLEYYFGMEDLFKFNHNLTADDFIQNYEKIPF